MMLLSLLGLGFRRGPRCGARFSLPLGLQRGEQAFECRVVVVQRLRAVFLRLVISLCLIAVWRVAWRDKRAYTISYKTEENCPH